MASNGLAEDLVFAIWGVARVDRARQIAEDFLARARAEVTVSEPDWLDEAARQIAERYCMRGEVEVEAGVVRNMILRLMEGARYGLR